MVNPVIQVCYIIEEAPESSRSFRGSVLILLNEVIEPEGLSCKGILCVEDTCQSRTPRSVAVTRSLDHARSWEMRRIISIRVMPCPWFRILSESESASTHQDIYIWLEKDILHKTLPSTHDQVDYNPYSKETSRFNKHCDGWSVKWSVEFSCHSFQFLPHWKESNAKHYRCVDIEGHGKRMIRCAKNGWPRYPCSIMRSHLWDKQRHRYR